MIYKESIRTHIIEAGNNPRRSFGFRELPLRSVPELNINAILFRAKGPTAKPGRRTRSVIDARR